VTVHAPTAVPPPNSTPTTATGIWLMATARTGRTITMAELYPCLCEPPCSSTGWRTCPCTGRQHDLDAMPEHCCARNARRRTRPAAASPAPPTFAAPVQGRDDEVIPATPMLTAPVQGNDDEALPQFRAPAARRGRPQFAAPRRGDLPDFRQPIRILETWERQSRRPGPGEADCWTCGELVAEQLVRQGYTHHVGC
jgi:hypothetical protein